MQNSYGSLTQWKQKAAPFPTTIDDARCQIPDVLNFGTGPYSIIHNPFKILFTLTELSIMLHNDRRPQRIWGEIGEQCARISALTTMIGTGY